MYMVEQFSVCYGLMCQFVNDNFDWILSCFGLDIKIKIFVDNFSDLCNIMLILLLFFYFVVGQGGKIDYFLECQMCWLFVFENVVFEEILDFDVLFKLVQNIRIFVEFVLVYLLVDDFNV